MRDLPLHRIPPTKLAALRTLSREPLALDTAPNGMRGWLIGCGLAERRGDTVVGTRAGRMLLAEIDAAAGLGEAA